MVLLMHPVASKRPGTPKSRGVKLASSGSSKKNRKASVKPYSGSLTYLRPAFSRMIRTPPRNTAYCWAMFYVEHSRLLHRRIRRSENVFSICEVLSRDAAEGSNALPLYSCQGARSKARGH